MTHVVRRRACRNARHTPQAHGTHQGKQGLGIDHGLP